MDREAVNVNAQQYRQTQSPDDRSRKARQDECEVKRRMTTHWDMDHLSREELEAEMSKGFGHEGTEPTGKPVQPRSPEDDNEGTDQTENPTRIGITLLIISVVLMAGAFLLLQSGGN